MCRNTLPTQSSETVERHSYLLRFSLSSSSLTCVTFKGSVFPLLIRGHRGISFTVSCSGDWQFEPFQEAQSEVAPRHWHGHRNRWTYSFPMVWPPFPGPLWGTWVCQWDMGQMVGYLWPDLCQENLHPFGNQKSTLLVHWRKKKGISLIIFSVRIQHFEGFA